MRGRITAAVITFLCVAGLLAAMMKCVAYAEEKPVNSALSGEVSLLRQDGDNYVMQVTVKNTGADFYGTVQVVFRLTTGWATVPIIRRSLSRPRVRNSLRLRFPIGLWT